MSKLRQLNLLLLVALAGAWSIAVQAEEIYHWVDADGVYHYSQSPPPAANSEVRTLDVDGSQPASYDPEADLYNIAAQKAATQAVWDKLAEDKKASQNTPDRTKNTVIYYPEPDSGNNIF
ncbi:MAG: DUF4124 domain-containing protein, partial [Xanthomonadales bacterium]|nr:DUF4124 domain-containing protein [Xanthomonadales bacterium]